MRFPIRQATGSLPGVSGEVHQQYSTSTGAGQVAASAGNLAQTAFNVNMMMYQKQGEIELAESMSSASAQVSDMFLKFETNTDEKTYGKKWDETFGKIKQAEPENGWARQQYRKAMFNVKDSIDGKVQEAFIRRVDDKKNAVVSKWIADARFTGDMSALENLTAGSVSKGTMTSETRDLILTQTRPYAEAKAKQNSVDQVSQVAMGIADLEGLDAAVKSLKGYLDAGQIDLDAYNTAKRQVVSEYTFNEAQRNEIKTQEEETSRQAIINEFVIPGNYTNISGRINAMPLTPEEKFSWISRLENRALAITGGGKDPFLQSDGAQLFDFTRRLNLDPASVSEAELAGAVGKGLNGGISISDYETLSKIVNGKQDSEALKREKTLLANYKTDNIFNKDEKKNTDLWAKADASLQKFWDDYVKQNGKPPSAKELEIRRNILTSEAVVSKWYSTVKFFSGLVPFADKLPSGKEMSAAIRSKVAELPLEGQQEFLQSVEKGESSLSFLDSFKKKPKTMTDDVKRTYIRIANSKIPPLGTNPTPQQIKNRQDAVIQKARQLAEEMNYNE